MTFNVGHALVLAICLASISTASVAADQDVPAAARHVARAEAIAGSKTAKPLFMCQPAGNATITQAQQGARTWLPPTQAFDDLYYVGNGFVGVWVLDTGAGLIMFDSGQSIAEARDHIAPGLVALGLDPANLKYVVVTHGHWDHYGGAPYWQQTYGARIALAGPDWDLMDRTPLGSIERLDRALPSRDMVVRDGDVIHLGSANVSLYVTPGHTPGTLSAIIPVHDGKTQYKLSLLGGSAFPPTIEPTERTGGLKAFAASVDRLRRISGAAGAVGVINTHIFVDGSAERLADVRRPRGNGRNPFVLGSKAVGRYYKVLEQCLLAAEERPMPDNEWAKPLTGTRKE